ncbi:MAG: 4Fe-4S binding protein [Candidatus Brocadiales bacterium]
MVKKLLDIWHWEVNSQRARWIIQIAFFLLVILISYKFYLFVEYCESGGTAEFVERPPGVEAFLPIGALMGIKYFMVTGSINPIHPAGFVILSTILLSAFLFGRGFCSWMCPVGTVSEWLWRAGDKVLGRNFRLPTILDWSLRSFKYLILFFFIYQIIIKLDSSFLADTFYQHVPYIRVADVQMMKFFMEIDKPTLIALGVLVGLSFLTRNFWCRYLCPYGAFLALLWYNNPLSVRVVRNEKCIDCGACSTACPVLLDVMRTDVVTSPECWHCYDCIKVCPVPGALEMKVAGRRWDVRYWVYAFVIIGFFVGMTSYAKYKGHWKTSVTTEEYIARVAELNDPKYEHKRGKFIVEDPASAPKF